MAASIESITPHVQHNIARVKRDEAIGQNVGAVFAGWSAVAGDNNDVNITFGSIISRSASGFRPYHIAHSIQCRWNERFWCRYSDIVVIFAFNFGVTRAILFIFSFSQFQLANDCCEMLRL